MVRAFLFQPKALPAVSHLEVAGIPAALAEAGAIVWIDLDKPDEAEATSVLDGIFHFHPLAIEDCIKPSPSPKVEDYEPGAEDKFAPHLFVVMHAVDYSRQDGKFATSELNFFWGANFLVTYHDVALRTITQMQARVEKEGARFGTGADRLAHLLIDTLVENYKPALDELSQEISALEQGALEERPKRNPMRDLLGLKKEVGTLSRIIGPQGEVLDRLASGDFPLIRPRLLPYFRDVRDKLTHIAELARSYAESLTGIMQVYLSLSSNQTGDVVKLLTLITVITTPLMMIGTWYGMNFKDMPELEWKHGYPIAGGAMLLSTLATYLYFKKRGWI